ncbi:MAG: plasmid stabilization protein [Puniceicoccaceae bacterium]|nr:MAG: plasmid stabilization protein [Puniceicoccaceae bacterium]
MSSITIRRLPEPTKEKLRVRAAQAGLSLEAYSRQLLQSASEAESHTPPNLADLAITYFGESNGIDLDLPPRGHDREPLAFD